MCPHEMLLPLGPTETPLPAPATGGLLRESARLSREHWGFVGSVDGGLTSASSMAFPPVLRGTDPSLTCRLLPVVLSL